MKLTPRMQTAKSLAASGAKFITLPAKDYLALVAAAEIHTGKIKQRIYWTCYGMERIERELSYYRKKLAEAKGEKQ